MVPDSVELQGTVRTFTVELLDLFERRMRRDDRQMAGAFELTADFGSAANYPATINHAAETGLPCARCSRVWWGRRTC